MMTTTTNLLSAAAMRLIEAMASITTPLKPAWARLSFVAGCKARALHAKIVWQILTRFASRPMEVSPLPALIIAPHQDDETLGCGGLIALKRQLGVKVTVVFLTDGAGSPVADSRLTPTRLVPLRVKEAAAALEALGVAREDVHFLDQLDGGLGQVSGEARRELEWELAELIRASGAKEIYLPHRQDAHPDHEAAFALTQQAVAIADTDVTLFQYVIWMTWLSPLFWRVHPRELRGALRLNVNSVMGKKCGAIGAYATQVPLFPPGFLNRFLWPRELFFPVLPEPAARAQPSDPVRDVPQGGSA